MGVIRFSHPQYLLLLPLVWAYTWWVLRGSLAELGRARARLAAGVRVALLLLLVLALAGMQWVRPTSTLCTVFVVDVSDSIAPALRAQALEYIHQAMQGMRADDQAALVVFGGEALLDHAPEDRTAIGKIVSIPSTSRTDIAAGIQLAMASFPQESGKQIILFSDGNENLGDAVDQAGLAEANGVRISVVPLERDISQGEALLLRVETPIEVRQGAPFQVNVLAESLRETDGTITLFRNDQAVEKRAVHLQVGKTAIAFEQTAPKSGLYHYRAILDVPAAVDSIPDNNTAYAYTRAQGKPAMLIIEGAPGEGERLARALRGYDIEVALGGPERIPASLAECALYDSLVFANVPAWRMSAAQMAIIRSAVRDTGMGFAMLGGNESFGAGAYYRTPIEEALPVTMDPKRRKQIPSVTLVIVIDISGSMSAMEGGVQKVRLAAEAAKAAVDVLQAQDQVCVIGYDTPDAFVVPVPMTKADNKARIHRQIDKLSAGGGGIMTYSSLKEARKHLQGANTQIKHIILCADAADTEEQEGCIPLARQMVNEKITLSVIGFGSPQDPDVRFHQELARAGNGNAYLAQRLSNLPQIFASDVLETSRSLLVEKPFQVQTEHASHAATKDIPWGSAPPLLGYVTTSKQDSPLAQVLLSSPDEDPILATWSYGLGRSLAFTSDAAPHWGAHWLSWEGYGPFWSQALRWTLRQGAKANFQTLLTEENGRATITVDAVTAEGEFRNLLDLQAHVSHVTPLGMQGPQVTQETIALEQTAPGHYEGGFDARATGTYVVTVEERAQGQTQSMQMATLVIPYSPEFQRVQVNSALLTKLAEHTSGVANPPASEVFRQMRFGSRSLRDLWPLLAVLLALLFLLDVAVRRVLLPWDELLASVRAAVAERRPKWQGRGAGRPARTKGSTLDTLLTAKEQVRPPRATAHALRSLGDDAGTRQGDFTPRDIEQAPAREAPEQPAAVEPAAPAASSGTVGTLLQKKRDRTGK